MFGAGLLSAELSGNNTTFNYGPDTPDPDNQDKPWFKTDANYQPERWYTYSNGAWVARHPIAPGLISLYLGSEASIETFDGGEAGAITATTGPMWEKVSAFDARFPIGAGTLPVLGTNIAVTNTGGTEQHSLTMAQLPATLRIPTRKEPTGTEPYLAHDNNNQGDQGVDRDTATDTVGGGTPITHLPPYIGVFFIRRTARLHYRI